MNALPLSFVQESLWFLHQLDPEVKGYHIPLAVRISGNLDIKGLEFAFTEVVRRHESLRTRFGVIDGKPFQKVENLPIFDFNMLDLQTKANKEEEIDRLIKIELHRHFNLEEGPLLRVSLFQLNVADYICLINVHHIATDGWSMKIFLREFEMYYASYVEKTPVFLPEIKMQYTDFSLWQRSYLKGDVLEGLLAYWKKQLEGNLSVLQLPTDRLRNSSQSFEGAVLTGILSIELTAKLKALSRQEDVTLFMTLLAAFNVLLHRYSGIDDILIGSNIANRNRKEIEGVIGCFVNTIVIRTNFFDKPTFRQLLRKVKKTTIEAYSHQDLPFEKLVQELQPERRDNHNPIFNVMFLLQNFAEETEKLNRTRQMLNLTISPIDIQNNTSKVELTLFVSEEEGILKLFFEYNTDLYDPSSIQRMMSDYQSLLEKFVTDPDCAVNDYSLVNDKEKQKLLSAFNKELI